jgi:hypothetical protein
MVLRRSRSSRRFSRFRFSKLHDDKTTKSNTNDIDFLGTTTATATQIPTDKRENECIHQPMKYLQDGDYDDLSIGTAEAYFLERERSELSLSETIMLRRDALSCTGIVEGNGMKVDTQSENKSEINRNHSEVLSTRDARTAPHRSSRPEGESRDVDDDHNNTFSKVIEGNDLQAYFEMVQQRESAAEEPRSKSPVFFDPVLDAEPPRRGRGRSRSRRRPSLWSGASRLRSKKVNRNDQLESETLDEQKQRNEEPKKEQVVSIDVMIQKDKEKEEAVDELDFDVISVQELESRSVTLKKSRRARSRALSRGRSLERASQSLRSVGASVKRGVRRASSLKPSSNRAARPKASIEDSSVVSTIATEIHSEKCIFGDEFIAL